MSDQLKKYEKRAEYQKVSTPVVCVIMDGVGIGPHDASDGVSQAYTPVLDALYREEIVTSLKAHGLAVGLPSDGDMGNSEVGHNALGSGRIFSQGATLVNEAIASGNVFAGDCWKQIVQRAQAGGTVHFIGLVSDGNVHSHIDHLYAMLDSCKNQGIKQVRVHGLLDGRDVEQKSALRYFQPLEEKLSDLSEQEGDYCIASGGGRMVTTMDRYEADWAVVEKGWQAHVLGEGRRFASACEAIRTYYQEDDQLTDQYMESFVIERDGIPVGTIQDGDAVICFNFRGDRAIEISRAFDEKELDTFDRKRVPDVLYAGMMQYDGDAMIPHNFLVNPPAINDTLGEYLCASGVRSYAVSETQKFGHVTYFWNGNKSGYIDDQLEKYVEIASDTITFDKKPWMKAYEITESVIAALSSDDYDFIRLNFPNGDMVGHTGVEPAVRIAVETVDMCLGRIAEAVKNRGGVLVVTADHGNADCMWTEKNGVRNPMVAHTKNPVPFIVKDYGSVPRFCLSDLAERGLANVAATLCLLLGFEPPAEYEPSLLALVQREGKQ